MQKRDTVSISGLRRSPGVRNGNLFKYSCLENSKDKGSWWATVHVVAKSWTWACVCVCTQSHTHTHTHTHRCRKERRWSHLVMSDSLLPRGLYSTRLLSPRNFPGKNTGVSSHFLHQGIFPNWTHVSALQADTLSPEPPGKPA